LRKFILAPGLVVEQVANDAIVLIPNSSRVLRLSGEAADLVRAASESPQTPEIHEGVFENLVQEGILVPHSGASRRSVLAAGFGAGLSGAVVLSLPGLAAASSSGNCPSVNAVPDSTDGDYGGAQVYFEVASVSFNTMPTPTTTLRLEIQFLPVGTYYYRISGPESGTLAAFSVEASFDVLQDGVYINQSLTRDGIVENGDLNAYSALISYTLFSDADRQCVIPSTSDYNLAAGV